MPDVQVKPEMSFRDLVEALTDAVCVTDPFERWLMEQRATALALASEHHAGCPHHVEGVVLDNVLRQYREVKRAS